MSPFADRIRWSLRSLRLGVGYFVAVIVALAVHHLPQHLLLRRGVLSEVSRLQIAQAARERLPVRVGNALRVAVADFLDVMVFFVLGVMVSALFSTSLNQELIMPLALNDWIATFSLMVFAGDPFSLQHFRRVHRRHLDLIPSRGEAGISCLRPNVRSETSLYLRRRVSKAVCRRIGCRPFSLDRNDLRAIENPWTMTGSLQRYLSAGVLTIWGIMLGYFVISGRLASYLHPSFHIWTAVSAVVLVLLAAGLLFLPETRAITSVSRAAIMCTISRRR